MAKALSKYLDPKSLMYLANVNVTAKYLVEGQYAGAHRSPFYGFAIEFAGHRGYVPGDDLKHLDWRVFFKTDRLWLNPRALPSPQPTPLGSRLESRRTGGVGGCHRGRRR